MAIRAPDGANKLDLRNVIKATRLLVVVLNTLRLQHMTITFGQNENVGSSNPFVSFLIRFCQKNLKAQLFFYILFEMKNKTFICGGFSQ